ncbi:MAG: hypothetical protein PUB42_01155 [Firmicutes bacterium]|nr:hypothetical protein [Bacillota bacterium]
MSKKNSKLPILIGAVAFTAYRFYTGRGIFNKIRFKDEHNAVSNYIESHHPSAIYSEITATRDGYSCVVTEEDNKFVLCFTKSPEGIYVFWENKM